MAPQSTDVLASEGPCISSSNGLTMTCARRSERKFCCGNMTLWIFFNVSAYWSLELVSKRVLRLTSADCRTRALYFEIWTWWSNKCEWRSKRLLILRTFLTDPSDLQNTSRFVDQLNVTVQVLILKIRDYSIWHSYFRIHAVFLWKKKISWPWDYISTKPTGQHNSSAQRFTDNRFHFSSLLQVS